MKDVFAGCLVAFAMYSKIPVPNIKWTERNMKYAICWFPLVGAVEAALLIGWYHLAVYLQLSSGLRAAVLAVLPILVNGGIHLDGFLDTSDALSSWKDREAKLEILKDSHCGAFAIICGLCYFILVFGICSEASAADIPFLGLSCVLVRAWSGLGLVMLQKAKNTGLLRTFSDAAANRRVAAVMVCYIVILCVVMTGMDSLRGGMTSMLIMLIFLYYREMSYQKFGGITGDLAGWFVQTAWLAAAFGVVLLR